MAIRFSPFHQDFGAEVRGVDLSKTLEAEEFRQIYDAFVRYGLLIFHDQKLKPEHEIAFARRFNKVRIYLGNDDTKLADYPEVNVLGNVTDADGKPVGFQNKVGIEWHTDGTGWPYPPVATVLYCLEAPSQGGETLYASGRRAWDDLPDHKKRQFDGIKVRYSFSRLYEKLNKVSGYDKRLDEEQSARAPDVVDPLVRTHAVTGQKALWFTEAEMACFEGMNENTSIELAQEIVGYISAPGHVYAHAWRPGDLLTWDNRWMHHSTTPYTYGNERRLIHRVSGEGDEVPV